MALGEVKVVPRMENSTSFREYDFVGLLKLGVHDFPGTKAAGWVKQDDVVLLDEADEYFSEVIRRQPSAYPILCGR